MNHWVARRIRMAPWRWLSSGLRQSQHMLQARTPSLLRCRSLPTPATWAAFYARWMPWAARRSSWWTGALILTIPPRCARDWARISATRSCIAVLRNLEVGMPSTKYILSGLLQIAEANSARWRLKGQRYCILAAKEMGCRKNNSPSAIKSCESQCRARLIH